MTRWPGALIVVILLFGVLGCDHTTKHLAVRHLADTDAMSLIPSVLELRRVQNTDTAFSLLGDVLDAPTRWGIILTLQSAATLGMLAFVVRRRKLAGTLERIAGALVLGGALGNLSDRLIRGYVVDFIHLSYWPVFNVADIAVVVGMGLFLLAYRGHPAQLAQP